jgi:hypothetical protein
MRKIIILVLAVLIPTSVMASENNNSNATINGIVSLAKGSITIRDSYFINTNRDLKNILLKAVIIYDPIKNNKIKGLELSVRNMNMIPNLASVFIEYGELDSLSKAIGYMLKLSSELYGKKTEYYTEVTFMTNGNYRIGFSKPKNGNPEILISAGLTPETVWTGQIDILQEVKEGIDTAIDLLKVK